MTDDLTWPTSAAAGLADDLAALDALLAGIAAAPPGTTPTPGSR